jgi:hypothetical protein
MNHAFIGGPGSSVRIATAYGLEGPGIESRLGDAIFRNCPVAVLMTAVNVVFCRPSCSNIDNVTPGADKSIARPTSRCILFDCENIYFDVFLLYI